jgi:hypothetical protein
MNLTLVIGTCDSYLAAVPNFVTLANRYFEPNVKRLFVGETIELQYKEYEWFLPGLDVWGNRMQKAIESVTTDYIFFILEDYYLSQKFTNEYIEYLIKFMDRHKADKISLTPVPDFACHRYAESINTMHRMRSDSDSMTSLQPAIWRTSEFLRINDVSYSPWDFEVKGDSKVKGIKESYYVAKLDEPIYFNLVRRGMILSDGWNEFFTKENLPSL